MGFLFIIFILGLIEHVHSKFNGGQSHLDVPLFMKFLIILSSKE